MDHRQAVIFIVLEALLKPSAVAAAENRYSYQERL
jgi:hypothetical protein